MQATFPPEMAKKPTKQQPPKSWSVYHIGAKQKLVGIIYDAPDEATAIARAIVEYQVPPDERGRHESITGAGGATLDEDMAETAASLYVSIAGDPHQKREQVVRQYPRQFQTLAKFLADLHFDGALQRPAPKRQRPPIVPLPFLGRHHC